VKSGFLSLSLVEAISISCLPPFLIGMFLRLRNFILLLFGDAKKYDAHAREEE